MTNEQRLIQAIVVQAVEDAMAAKIMFRRDMKALEASPESGTAYPDRKVYYQVEHAKERQSTGNSARKWIMDDNPRKFGFLWCCEWGELNMLQIRKRLCDDASIQRYRELRRGK
jgi:hypothetical protein